MRDPSGENERPYFGRGSRVICTGSPSGMSLTYSWSGVRNQFSLRINASTRPSGDKAGDTAASVKLVICVYVSSRLAGRIRQTSRFGNFLRLAYDSEDRLHSVTVHPRLDVRGAIPDSLLAPEKRPAVLGRSVASF